MKKKIFLFLAIAFLFKAITFSAVIESNHSYLKNSNILNDFEVSFSAFGDFKIYNFGLEKSNIATLSEKKTTNALNDISINLDLRGKIDDATSYGVKTIVNYNNEFKKENSYFLYLKNIFGRIEVGNVLSSAEEMKIGGDTLVVGSGSNFNNDFNRMLFKNINRINLIALNNFFDNLGSFLTREGTLSSQMFGYFNRKMDLDRFDEFNYKTKINYYSPDFGGTQFFLTYVFDNKLYNKVVDTTTANLTSFLNIGDIYSYGLNYINTFDNLGIGLSYIKEGNRIGLGDSTALDLNVDSQIFGVNLNYFGFILSASKGILKRNKNSLSTNALATSIDTKYDNYGISYEVNGVAISYNYYKSLTNKKNEYLSNLFVAEYKMDKNASLYAEMMKFYAKDTLSGDKLDGRMLSVGLLISFY